MEEEMGFTRLGVWVEERECKLLRVGRRMGR